MREFSPIAGLRLRPGSTFGRPVQTLPSSVMLDSPALDVMTDFEKVSAVTIAPQATMEHANRKMIENGVRLLVVIDAANVVLGILSAADILGEKPLRLRQEKGLARSEITVDDLMTAQRDLDVLAIDVVRAAKVGHIVATLQSWGRQHAIVVESDGAAHAVRGVFSASQIARSLGVPVHTAEVARTFAEIEAILR